MTITEQLSEYRGRRVRITYNSAAAGDVLYGVLQRQAFAENPWTADGHILDVENIESVELVGDVPDDEDEDA